MSETSETAPDVRTSTGTAPDREAGSKAPPVIDSPPTAPQPSPWWTAPGGKAVNIPDFGHMLAALREALLAPFAPSPRPIPIRIRAYTRSRR